ncbi:uncharacterized protein LAESUDRAFT_756359 [Laetiporus sulphureus 93-53]|uniref:Uncharacterized protein n=1 Tax=Laetiporus sulphureus 93-53 TaxID=1314785 RepID=A0A165GCV4_9APHY|nr:uncharacterized protein LAESUDRAFT_756359 [Laetiporus sulphureus 93-53]KZT10173.1 hypothetical protein LAESUDRAFT_756359 [Laetiporus sulphureus 93-53]
MLLDNEFVYFAVSLPLNVLAIVMWLYTSYGDVVTLFVEPISSILISRCLLDLRGAVDPNDDELEPDDVSFDDISFAAWRSSQFRSQIEDTTHSQRTVGP